MLKPKGLGQDTLIGLSCGGADSISIYAARRSHFHFRFHLFTKPATWGHTLGAHILQQPEPSEFLSLPASQSRVLSIAQLQGHLLCQPTPHADASRCPVAGDGRQPGRPEEGGGWGQQQWLWGSHLHRWIPAGRRQQLWGRWPQLHCRSVHGFFLSAPLSASWGLGVWLHW